MRFKKRIMPKLMLPLSKGQPPFFHYAFLGCNAFIIPALKRNGKREGGRWGKRRPPAGLHTLIPYGILKVGCFILRKELQKWK